MVISTVLGRFVIPIYYVLGERLIQAFGGGVESAGTEQGVRGPEAPIKHRDEE
jgi:hypothetical protein